MPWRIWPLVLAALFVISVDVRGAAPTAINGDFAGLIDIGGGAEALSRMQRCRQQAGFENDNRTGNRADIWSGSTSRRRFVDLPLTRVCAYDRPGTTLGADQFSRSDPVPMPRTVKDAVADLHALLKAAIPSPYVLVGHPTGGLVSRLYASTYPKEVVGLVLVDAIPEGVQTAMKPDAGAASLSRGRCRQIRRKCSPPIRTLRPSTSM